MKEGPEEMIMKKAFETTVPLLPPKQRLNPQMLRIVLAQLIKSRFGGIKKHAYETLKTSRSRFHPTTNRRLVPFDKNSLPDILNDKRQITYVMLEAFADEAGIPTWVLLLFSRTLSDDIDSRKSRHQISESDLAATKLNIARTVAFLEEITVRLRSSEQPMNVEMIDDWIALYQEGAEGDQPALI